MIAFTFLKRLLLFSLVVVSACRKAQIEVPLPAAEEDIPLTRGYPSEKNLHGYLLALHDDNQYGFVVGKNWVLFASFGDPPRQMPGTFDRFNVKLDESLINGNVQPGDVRMDTIILTPKELTEARTYYMGQRKAGENYNIKWSISGKSTFLPQQIVPPDAVPQMTADVSPVKIKKTNGLFINLDTVVTNFDSAHVLLINHQMGSVVTAKRSLGANEKYVSFSPAELNDINNLGNVTLVYFATKYFHIKTNGKLFLLECSRRVSKRAYPG